MRAFSLSMVLLTVAAGCSAPGDPLPVRALPARPADLAIMDVRGCDVLSSPQKTVLGVTSGKQETPEGASTGDCIYLAGDEAYIAQVFPRTAADVDLPGSPNFQDGSGSVGPRVVTVDGYGAIEAGQAFNYSNYRCNLTVDVGPNASIVLGYENTSPEARSRTVGSREEGCARASRFASMVLATVKAKQNP